MPWGGSSGTTADLYNGAGTAGGNSESGAVTVWVTVSDADEGKRYTNYWTTAAGTILVKHVEGTGSLKLASQQEALHLMMQQLDPQEPN